MLPLLLEQQRRIFKLPCMAYGVGELHDRWCLHPQILLVVLYSRNLMHFTRTLSWELYIGQEVSTTVTSVLTYYMLTLLQ